MVWSPENDLFCTLDGETKDYCTPQTYVGLPGRFYHNNGDGTFTETGSVSGIAYDENGKDIDGIGQPRLVFT